jgi:hypothetical protein
MHIDAQQQIMTKPEIVNGTPPNRPPQPAIQTESFVVEARPKIPPQTVLHDRQGSDDPDPPEIRRSHIPWVGVIGSPPPKPGPSVSAVTPQDHAATMRPNLHRCQSSDEVTSDEEEVFRVEKPAPSRPLPSHRKVKRHRSSNLRECPLLSDSSTFSEPGPSSPIQVQRIDLAGAAMQAPTAPQSTVSVYPVAPKRPKTRVDPPPPADTFIQCTGKKGLHTGNVLEHDMMKGWDGEMSDLTGPISKAVFTKDMNTKEEVEHKFAGST